MLTPPIEAGLNFISLSILAADRNMLARTMLCPDDLTFVIDVGLDFHNTGILCLLASMGIPANSRDDFRHHRVRGAGAATLSLFSRLAGGAGFGFVETGAPEALAGGSGVTATGAEGGGAEATGSDFCWRS